jgi:uncharacterized protein
VTNTLTRRKFIKRLVFFIASVFVIDAFWFECFFIQTKEYFLGNATKATTNIKVVQISDLHLKNLNYQLKRLAKQINQLKPHLILITGDAVDKANNVALLNDFLYLIDHNINKVAILGNWEYWGKIDLQ